MAHSRPLFLFCVFSTVNSKYVHFDSIRTADLWYQKCLLCRLSHNHRHLREIGCSLAIVGGVGQLLALNVGANQHNCLSYGAKSAS